MIDIQDHVVDDNWIVHPQNEELQNEVDFARAQWSQGDGDPVFFVADLIEGTVRSVIVSSEVVEEIGESVELERLMESFDPLKGVDDSIARMARPAASNDYNYSTEEPKDGEGASKKKRKWTKTQEALFKTWRDYP